MGVKVKVKLKSIIRTVRIFLQENGMESSKEKWAIIKIDKEKERKKKTQKESNYLSRKSSESLTEKKIKSISTFWKQKNIIKTGTYCFKKKKKKNIRNQTLQLKMAERNIYLLKMDTKKSRKLGLKRRNFMTAWNKKLSFYIYTPQPS